MLLCIDADNCYAEQYCYAAGVEERHSSDGGEGGRERSEMREVCVEAVDDVGQPIAVI